MMPRSVALLTSITHGPSQRYRDGFVLPAALLAIVLIGALVAGVLFATTEDTRAGATSVAREMALIATESAVAMTVTDPAAMLPASIGVAGSTSRRYDRQGQPVVVYITRLDSTTYWIVAETGADPSQSRARQRVGLVVKAVEGSGGSITIGPISQRAWSDLF
jgi:hypothetical protein